MAKSASTTTRALIQNFIANEDRLLRKMQDRLRTEQFRFEPARGVAIEKPGKSTKRPLMIFDIESRIVQRAILDIVKELPSIRGTLTSGFNFGGIEGPSHGVPAAIAAAQNGTRSYGYFIRSDIKAFFDSVARDEAIACLTGSISDPAFIALIRAATSVELSNRMELGSDIQYFPTEDYGLAQGSCLSPLLCNLVLANFDRAMNSKGTVCVRYIDDFILFAADRKRARAAMSAGDLLLGALGLKAYDPVSSPDKAEEGAVTTPISFLGCELRDGSVRPSLKNRRTILKKVKRALATADGSWIDQLTEVRRILLGWGNTFGFCDDENSFRDLDTIIENYVRNWMRNRSGTLRNVDGNTYLTMLGIQPLSARTKPSKPMSRSSPQLGRCT